MKKNILSMAALLISSTTFVACSSDDNIIDQQPAQSAGQQVYTMTVNAQKGGDAATSRALTLSGKTLNATWATTENVYVKKGDTWATGSLQPDANAATATLKGELTGITIAADDVLTLQFPKSGEISYAGQVGTLEDIAADFDYATATVTVASVSATGNIIPEAATTTFENQQAIVKFTLINKADGTTSLSASELTVSDGANTYTVTPASATSEIYAAIPGFSGKTVTLTATVGGKTYTYEKSGVSFTNGKYYEITVKMTEVPIPEGAISGKFSVSSKQKVYFSKGNLQATYNGSSWSWGFAENQWDYIGDATGNTKVTATYPFISENATVDLFGWVGASSDWTDAAQYGITSSTKTDNTNGYGNNVGEGLKSDWGTLMGDGWRTLTGGSGGEWEWLLGPSSSPDPGTNCRTSSTVNGTANARFAKATVAGKTGMILFPDSYTHPSGVTAPTSINTRGAAYTANSYDATDWGKMEAAGCVFLPAAGCRSGASVSNSYGNYWSSTPYYTSFAYSMHFSSFSFNPQGENSRYYGFSVRLVRDAQ